MNKLFLLFFLFSISVFNCHAQKKRGVMGVGISAGATNYEGDLDDNFTLVFTRPGFGAHVIFLPFARLHFRVNIFHGQITASDASANFTNNKSRNLEFSSDIDEASLNFLYIIQSRQKEFSTRNRIAPYVFAGIAYFRFNPEREVSGKEYDLRDVGTEGQFLAGDYPKPYSLQQFSIPAGIGFKLKLNERFDFGAESGFRKTFTDYLDDVSTNYPDKNLLFEKEGATALFLSDPSNDPAFANGRGSFSVRGNARNKDWYVYTNINFTYYFTTNLFNSYKLKSKFRNNSCKGLGGR